MLKKLIEKVTSKSAFTSPRIIVCYPSGVTEVERRAIEEAAKFAGARDVVLMEEPMAAAIGAGQLQLEQGFQLENQQVV